MLERKDYYNFFGFYWKDMYDDLSRICFLFFELLLFVVCDILFVFFSKFFVYIMLVVVVVLYGRN